MKLAVKYFLSACLLLNAVISISGNQTHLRVNTIPEFPFPAGSNFTIEIVEKENGKQIYGNSHDILIIQISDSSKKQQAIFEYIYKDMIDMEIKGDFMRIPTWTKFKSQIIATMLFDRSANDKTLEIFQITASNNNEKRNQMKTLNKNSRIYQSKISLLIDPKLELLITSMDGRKFELMLDEWGKASCRAFDGVPMEKPYWDKNFDLKMRNPKYSPERNERTIEIYASILDHMKELSCTAGRTRAAVKINVLHHPTQILLDPELGSFVENGTTTYCSSIDGFPVPEVRWHFISGPDDPGRYFNISKDGRKLLLKSETPIGTVWKFNCTASNILPRTKGSFNRTVSFEIGRPQEGLFGLNLTFQIMVGVAVMGAIIIFCIAMVFIVCLARRSCVDQNATRNNRRNGVPAKHVVEKKTLDSEQVTLLPPGAPQNHLDLANTGSGLPLPPPEYQLIIDNSEVKPAIPLEPQVSTEPYAEVTYAELNTSDLPMKESRGHKFNNNNNNSDEYNQQVIYSQIIGTISTPDPGQRTYMNQDSV